MTARARLSVELPRSERCRRAAAFLLLVALLFSRAAVAQDLPIEDLAKAHFERGIELVDQGRFEDASVDFERAYALSPHPSVLYNLGMALSAARRPAAAMKALQRYLETRGNDVGSERAAKVRSQLDALRTQIASLAITSQPTNAVTLVDGRPVDDPLDVIVDSGSHVVTASAPGHAPASRELVVRSGDRLELKLVLQPSPTPAPGHAGAARLNQSFVRAQETEAERRFAIEQAKRRRAWIAGSTAVGGLVLAAVTTGLALDNRSRYSAWQSEQATLDELWLTATPTSEPTARQAANDAVADRIKLQDEITVGVGVASGACLVVAAVVWLVGSERTEPKAHANLGMGVGGGEISVSW